MKEHFCVRCILDQNEYEIEVARWYFLGAEGCIETPIDDCKVEVKVFFWNAEKARIAADELKKNIRSSDSVGIETVPDKDWNFCWRASMQPAQLASSWWVSPPWLPPPLSKGDKWIKIEPKRAFGTGHHESTRLTAKMLIDTVRTAGRCSVLDIGTGSGILCFAAAMAGAERCIGLEIDPECRDNLAENRILNAGCNVSFVIGSIDSICKDTRFDLIVMNIIHSEASPLLTKCRFLLSPTGILIWSGILSDRKMEAVEDALTGGFLLNLEITENEWWCGRFYRK